MNNTGKQHPPIQAVVANVVTNPMDETRSYVVANPAEHNDVLRRQDEITFFLCHWHGEGKGPEVGQRVELRGLTRYQQGWRAESAHFIRTHSAM